jgi:hypothetical protein
MNKVERILEYSKVKPEKELFKTNNSNQKNPENPPKIEDLYSISLFDDENHEDDDNSIPYIDHPNAKNWPSKGSITFQNVSMR